MARKRTGDATYHSPTSRGSQNSCREPLGHTGATVTSNPTTLSGTWCVPRRSPPPSPIMRKRRVVCVSDKLWRGRGERYDCDSVYIDERGRTLKASAMVHRCPSTTSSKVSQHMYLQRRPQHQVSLDNINILDWTRILWNRGERNSVHQAAKTWPERRWGLFLPPPRVESIKQVMTWRSNHQCRSSEEDQVNWSKDRVSFHLHNYITLSTNFTVHCQIKFGQVSHEQKVTGFTSFEFSMCDTNSNVLTKTCKLFLSVHVFKPSSPEPIYKHHQVSRSPVKSAVWIPHASEGGQHADWQADAQLYFINTQQVRILGLRRWQYLSSINAWAPYNQCWFWEEFLSLLAHLFSQGPHFFKGGSPW